MKKYMFPALVLALTLTACGAPTAEVTPVETPAATLTATPVPTPELTEEPNIAALQVEEHYGQITKDNQFTMTLIVNGGEAGSYPVGGGDRITSITDEWSGYQWEQAAEPDIPQGTDQLIFSREEQSFVFYDLDGLVEYREGEDSQRSLKPTNICAHCAPTIPSQSRI